MRERTPTAIIYARVSTARQADDGLPVESQIDQCQSKAKSLGAVVSHVYRDDGISGRTSQRPGFMAALDHCEMHPTDFFICWSSSRFARNHIDAAINKRLLDRIGTKLVFVSQDFGESDEAWMIESIVAIMDEQYSRSIAKDTRRSMAKNAEDGFWNGGHVPFGYYPVALGKRKRLAIMESEAAVVKTIFRWCLEGNGQKNIAVRLNESGISRRGAIWTKHTVNSVLRSTAVIGNVVFRDRERLITTRSHDPIISEELFAMVQNTISERLPALVGGKSRSKAVFSGILHCGACGSPMMTESATGRSGLRYHYYNCRSFLKGAGCESRRLPVANLDEYLLETISERIFTAENIAGIVFDIKHQAGQWARDKQISIDNMAGELAGVEKRLKRLYETIEAGAGLNLNDIAPRLRELRAQQDRLKIEIERLDLDQGPETTLTGDEIAGAARIFREVLVTADSPKKVREFLGNVISKITVGESELQLEYLPSRLATARFGGSHCEVRWLPDPFSLRTAFIVLPLPVQWRKAA